jgi:uncharacterized repeat protein (TIGR03803 family)
MKAGLSGKSRLTQTPIHVPMKASLSTTSRRLLRLTFLAFIISLFGMPAARAGLTMTIDFYRNSQGQNYQFYLPIATNTVGPNAALGTYVISSPGWPAGGTRQGFDLTTNGINGRGDLSGQNPAYPDFNSALQQITNGTWTILFTNAASTNFYKFTVSAPTINSNLMPLTLITSPANGAINVPNQPTFTWQGPTSWPVTTANTYFYNYDFSFFQFPAPLPASQTVWPDPTPLPNGLNCTFNLDYVTNYSGPLFVSTTPDSTNVSHQPISGWAIATILETGDSVSFAVTNPPALFTALIAHYTFDNSGNIGQDTSGNGYDLDFNGADGVAFNSTAKAGAGAAYFDGFSFLSYTSTPGRILSTLAGDFSLSFWLKTTQNDGNEGGEAYAGAGIVAADVPGSHYDVVPAALDGGEIGFNTGPDDDTLNSTVDLNDGNYHHVVITRQQAIGEKQIYVDGQLNTTDFASVNPLSDPHIVSVGCQIDASQSNPGSANISGLYQGLLDDIQIYSGVLSSTQVGQLYANPGTTAAASLDFNDALGTSGLTWTTNGDSDWFIESTNTANGSPYAAQSGIVTNNQSSILSVTVTGPGTLTFYWASQDDCNNFDYEFSIDGNDTSDLSCSPPWAQAGPYSIGTGTHTLTWTASAGGDNDPTEAAFLSQVSYVEQFVPVLSVTDSPTAGAVPLTVQFTSPGVESFGNTVTNWNWAFGDGGTSTAQNPSHTYTTTGSFTPGLTAYSTYGSVALVVTGLGTITVTNVALNVSTIPSAGLAPLTVQFASPGVDSGGNTVTNWNWSFGDGGTSTEQNPVHVYKTIGSYSPGLVAESTHGASALPVNGLGAINVYSNPIPAFHTIYTFSPDFGKAPDDDLAISGNQLYGTTENGGGSNGLGAGTVFAINTDGNAFTNLYVFASSNGYPVGGLALSGSTLFGIGGSVFAINTNGTGYTNLLVLVSAFDSPTGYNPVSGLAVAGNTLYGTTWYGGPYDEGGLFTVATNGASHGFFYPIPQPSYNNFGYAINYAGIFPSARLICPAGTLYGTEEQGGSYGGGTVFSVVTNEPGTYTVLHDFTAPALNGTNIDGYASFSPLVLSGTNLYGTTVAGGAYGYGTVFAVSTTGQFTNLYSFTGGSDGSEPLAGLTLSGNTLYGTTSTGGAFTNGTLFAINTDGSNFKSVYSFTGGNDGGDPAADMILAGSTLFGTTIKGGSTGNGTLFSFALAGPPLAIAHSGTNVVLTWSTAFPGYTLQSSTQLVAGATWSSVSPLPVVLNNLNTVTNPASAMTKYYRLSQ